MASMMRCRAESAPIVMSVPQKSLSIEPTNPTMFRCAHSVAFSAVILPAQKVHQKINTENFGIWKNGKQHCIRQLT